MGIEPVQPGIGRRHAAGNGRRRVAHAAAAPRGAADPRAELHGGRRPAGDRDHRLRPLAVALWRRPGSPRPKDRSERDAAYGCWCRAQRVPVPRFRVPALDAARRPGAEGGRTGAGPLPPHLQCRRPPPDRRHAAARAGGGRRHQPTARRCLSADERGRPLDGRGSLRPTRGQRAAGPDDSPRHRRPAAPDRLCQRREPDARAHDRARTRDGDPHRAWSGAWEAAATADHREPRACDRGRDPRPPRGNVGNRSAPRRARVSPSPRRRDPPGRRRAHLHARRHPPDRFVLRARPRSADGDRAVRLSQGGRTRAGDRRTGPARAARHRDGGDGPCRRGTRRRRAARAQLPVPYGPGRRLRARRPALVQRAVDQGARGVPRPGGCGAHGTARGTAGGRDGGRRDRSAGCDAAARDAIRRRRADADGRAGRSVLHRCHARILRGAAHPRPPGTGD